MKKGLIVIIPTIIIVILIMGSLFVYATTNSQNQSSDLKEKVLQEVKYLNSYIVAILGNFNGLTIENSVFQLSPEETELEKTENKSSDITSEENQGGEESSNSGTSQGEGNQSSEAGSEKNQESKSENQSNQNNNNNQSGESDKTSGGILNHNGKYETKWKEIKTQIEELYSTWNTISLDLHALNINGDMILSFSNILNSATQNIKKQDKAKSMEELGKLHQLLAQYMNSYASNTTENELLKVEVQAVSAYINATNENWEEASENTNLAEQTLAGIINSVGIQNNQKQTTINQCYILVNELKNAVNIKDKDIFYIQYQNLITKMEILF